MTKSQLTGAWFGLTPGDVHFYRLELLAEGTGIFGSAYWTNRPQVYRIKNWDLHGQRLTFAVTPADRESEAISLAGVTVGQTIEMSIRGSTWQHVVSLRREDAFEEVARKVKQGMAKLGGAQQ